MKKKVFFLIFFLLLVYTNFNVFVYSAGPELVSKNDFYLIDFNKNASINEKHYLSIGFDNSIELNKSDITYKLIGTNEDILEFNRCVDVKINVSKNNFEFVGIVKEWGIYNVDIQPKIDKYSLTLTDYIWWNSSFQYRNCSQICNNITNYEVFLNLSWNSNMQTDFGDIRFVGDNTTELYHWREYKVDSSYAHYWINISTFDWICMYYGNDVVSDTSYNDPDNTFLFFEDFNSIAEWTNNGDSHFSLSDGICTISQDSSWGRIYYDIGQGKYKVKQKTYADDLAVNSGLIHTGFYTGILSSWTFSEANSMGLDIYDRYSDVTSMIRVFVCDNANTRTDIDYTRAEGFEEDVWYRSLIYYYDKGYIYDDDNKILDSTTGISGTFTNPRYLYIQSRSYGVAFIVKYDWLFVGQYADTEPTFCNWIGEEELPVGEDNLNINNCIPINESIVFSCDLYNFSCYTYNTGGSNYNVTVTNSFNNTIIYNNICNVSVTLNFTSFIYVDTNITIWVNMTNGSSWWNYTVWFVTNSSFCDCLKEDSIVDIGIAENLAILILWIFISYLVVRSKETVEVIPLSIGLGLLATYMILGFDLFDDLYIITLTTCIIIIPFIRLWKK